MTLEIISYNDLLQSENNPSALKQLEAALLTKGIVGISHVPDFENKSRAYVNAARQFSALEDAVKQQYAPNRDAGDTEGYELGAEWFKNKDGIWQRDDKKSSYYAFVPNHARNKWPREVDLKTAYLELGELIFNTGKLLLKVMSLDETVGLQHNELVGYGRMLHYYRDNDATPANSNWCGAHFDHGIFTGLMPAYYFQGDKEVDEPAEAGLFIIPTQGKDFEKIPASDKSIILFQVGEFGQLISHDRIRATKHTVRKAGNGLDRFSFALFYSAPQHYTIQSRSELTQDARYVENKFENGSISYQKWEAASYEQYRAK